MIATYFNCCPHLQEFNYGAPLPVERFPRVPQLPTFWEFVQYVLHSDNSRNEHWSPIHTQCPVCSARFDNVVHFENLRHEEAELERALGLDGELEEGGFKHLNANSVGRSEENVTKTYFDTLDDEDIVALYEMYEWDFKMFGYEFEFRKMKFPLSNT